MSVASWLLLVAIINIVATWLYPASSYGIAQVLSTSERLGVVLYSVTFLIVTPIISIWVFNTTTRLIDREMQGKAISLREVSREGWHFFFARILVGFLVALSVVATSLLTVPGFFLSILGNSIAPVLAIPGSILFILGLFGAVVIGTILAIRLFFSAYQLLLEDKHGRQALRASWKLTQDRGWATFWRMVLPKVIFFFGIFTIQLFLVYLLKIFATNLAGLNFELGVRIYAIGSTTIFLVLYALVNPLIMSADYLLFRSLQEQEL